MSQANTTTDHDEIRRWIEQRGGRPTVVSGTEGADGEGILRVDFDPPEDKLEEIPWEAFFQTFEHRKLAFLHQDKTADGHVSRFFKFVHRTGDEKGRPERPRTGEEQGRSERPAPERKGSPSSDDDADLKAREYKDAQGNVHHHTRAYMESRDK